MAKSDKGAKVADEFVVKDLETLKAISDPIRLRIVEAMMGEPATVKQIAARMGIAQSKLYYHVNTLEKFGLIHVVSTQIVSGIVEKWYKCVASSIRIDRTLFALDRESGGESLKMLTMILERTATQIQNSIAAGIIDLREEAEPIDRLQMSRSATFLTREQAAYVSEKMNAFLDEFREMNPDDGPRPEGARAYCLTVAFFPFEFEGNIDNEQ
jgi:DNA-binding transcriptional ArsR family regulator